MYDVLWPDYAIDRLAEIYVELDLQSQDRVAGAVKMLNQRLAINPLLVGEERDGDRRIVFVDLLAIRF